MPYASVAGYGTGLAALGFAAGNLWLVALCAAAVLAGALLVRCTFRRGMAPLDR